MVLKEKIEELFGIDDLFLKTRRRKLVDARTMYFGYRRYVEGLTLHEIAKQVDQSHCNIVHSLKNFKYVTEDLYPMEWQVIISNDVKEVDVLYKLENYIKHLEERINVLEDYAKPFVKAEQHDILDFVREKVDNIVKAKIKTIIK